MNSIPPLLLGAVLVSALLVGSGCEHRTRSAAAASSDTTAGPVPTHVSWDANFTMIKKGHRRAVLKASRMEQYTVADSTYSVWRSTPSDTLRVRTYLFDSQGDSSATMTADSVVFQDGKGRLVAYGDVVVTTESNKRLESEKLTWRQADRRIRTQRFVRITTPEEVVEGEGLVAEEDLDTYQIGQFHARVEVDDQGKNSEKDDG
ncbi:MAG: LPS export ABC transporter periplasmic protein LptC [Salinibacter sp.]|uniref:LPS export ABC transporter periplasmic protein LptC n=1 Tax=Salinibacter sp. TaxID=2065818 RepID=UPI0035D43157